MYNLQSLCFNLLVSVKIVGCWDDSTPCSFRNPPSSSLNNTLRVNAPPPKCRKYDFIEPNSDNLLSVFLNVTVYWFTRSIQFAARAEVTSHLRMYYF